MENMIDKLLKLDAKKLEGKATATVEIPRLSKLMGDKFIVTVKALPNARYSEIQESALNLDNKGNFEGINTFAMQSKLCLAGVVEPDLKDKALREHLGAATPLDTLNKLFNTFEITRIATEISKLCGFEDSQDKVDNAVKN